jgi:hypothetical protein
MVKANYYKLKENKLIMKKTMLKEEADDDDDCCCCWCVMKLYVEIRKDSRIKTEIIKNSKPDSL